MNVQMINTLAIYMRIAQTQMEVTLVIASMVIPVMETFVLVNILLSLKSYFPFLFINSCFVTGLSFMQM